MPIPGGAIVLLGREELKKSDGPLPDGISIHHMRYCAQCYRRRVEWPPAPPLHLKPPLTHTDGRSASFDRGGDRKNAVSEVAGVMVEMVIVEF